jgi:hypothetical protein
LSQNGKVWEVVVVVTLYSSRLDSPKSLVDCYFPGTIFNVGGCTHLDLILPRVLLIVTFLGRYLTSAVGLLSICLFFLGTLSDSLAGDDAPTNMQAII